MERDAPKAHGACCKISLSLIDLQKGEEKAQACDIA
jgi:hypothetical protein